MFEDLREDFGGGGDSGVGKLLAQDLRHALLVGGVGMGVDEADRHGLNFLAAQDAGDAASFCLIERGDLCAVEVDAFFDLVAVAAADIGFRNVVVGIPQLVLRTITNLQDIAEALRGDERCRREAALDQRVGGHRGAVGENVDLVELDVGLLEAVHHCLHWVIRGGGDLRY